MKFSAIAMTAIGLIAVIGLMSQDSQTGSQSMGRKLLQFMQTSGSFTMSIGDNGAITTSGSFTMESSSNYAEPQFEPQEEEEEAPAPIESTLDHIKELSEELEAEFESVVNPKTKEDTIAAVSEATSESQPDAPDKTICFHNEDTADHKCYEACSKRGEEFKVKGLATPGACPSTYNEQDKKEVLKVCNDGVTSIKYCSGGSLKKVLLIEKTKGIAGISSEIAMDTHLTGWNHLALYCVLAIMLLGFSIMICKRRRKYNSVIMLESEYKKAASSENQV